MRLHSVDSTCSFGAGQLVAFFENDIQDDVDVYGYGSCRYVDAEIRLRLVMRCACLGVRLFLSSSCDGFCQRGNMGKALSPLLSFCFAQVLIAVVVLVGNMAGKQISIFEASFPGAFELTCGVSVLALFLLLMRQATENNTLHETCSCDEAYARIDEGGTRTGDAFRYSDQDVRDKTTMDEGVEPRDRSLELLDDKENDGHGFSSDDAKAAMFAESFGLTKRESEVFSYLSKGRSLPYIADKLFVTTGTVKTNTTHIYRKLGVKSKQELLDLFDGWS